MPLNVDEKSLKQGVLALVVTLAEVIEETLTHQAIRRMETGDLTDDELNRLGEALRDLEEALERIKVDHGIVGSVAELRRGLDGVVDEVVGKLVNPERWIEESK